MDSPTVVDLSRIADLFYMFAFLGAISVSVLAVAILHARRKGRIE